ncbi:MAG: methyltransferase domain-containing protein [gamma proteobacterium symbiont of Taylorina sp.]|nr:methyltransferase domain-containing protein [gamma proteobacterium symbiont of Taylorina sp.]
MKETSIQEIQQLIENIKLQAETIDSNKNEFQPSVTENSFLSSITPAKDEIYSYSPEFEHRNDFLCYQDIDFVQWAYKGILLRKPDVIGKKNYLNQLRKGKSRQSLLASMMLSREGRQKAVPIDGMKWLLIRTRIFNKLSLPGRILQRLANYSDKLMQPKFDYALYKLHIMEWQQQKNFSRILLQQQINKSSNRELYEELKQSIQTSQDQLQTTQQQLQTTQAHLAEVRMQFNYQQRNQDLFLQQLINDNEQKMTGVQTSAQQQEREQHQQTLLEHRNDKLDAYYIAFEDACRGTREEIKNNLKIYLPLIEKVMDKISSTTENDIKNTIDVLDLGCGRGEWLQLLNEQHWQTAGIDNNKIMVQDCQNLGLNVHIADVHQYLKQQPSESVCVISSFHLIEHIPFAHLLSLFEESIRILKPGGLILFETPNPENILVGSHTFYHDPTHTNPLTPTAMQFLARYTGFTEIEIERLHPYPEEAKVPGDDILTQRVNGHLCGPQDYALIAGKPLKTASMS